MTIQIALKTEEEIVLATDSKYVWEEESAPGIICKIFQLGKYFLSTSGLGFYEPTSFYIDRIANGIITNPDDILESITIFHNAVEPNLRTALLAMKQRNPTQYESRAKGRIVIRTVLTGWLEDSPQIAVRTLRAEEVRGSIDFVADQQEESLNDEPAMFLYGPDGVYDEIVEFLKTQQKGWWKVDLVKTVHAFMDIAFSVNQQQIGPPITILKIKQDGAVWVQNESICAEILKPGTELSP